MLINKILDPKITDIGIKENNINEKLILILFIFYLNILHTILFDLWTVFSSSLIIFT